MMHVQKMIILILLSLFCPSYGNYLELQLSEELYNIDIDNETNTIFIGGKNLLLKASSTLRELKRITTGPKMDYIECLESQPVCAPNNTDNRNKILLIDNRNKKLITCGSLTHGVCQGRNLETLSVEISNNNEYVVSNSHLPSVAVIGPSWDGKPALYVATSWDGKTYGSDILKVLINPKPSVSTRNIDGSNVFAVSINSALDGYSYLKFTDLNYVVKYVYGFTLGDFTYFVSVQETTESYNQKKIPKVFSTFIIRICQRDKNYFSYLELPLECKGTNGTNFNIGTSAYLTKPGNFFAKSSGIQASDEVLVVTFVQTNGGWNDRASKSGVCFYPVKEINEKLAADQKKCADGSYSTEEYGLPWADDVKNCATTGSSSPTILPNFCPVSILAFKYVKYRSIKLSAAKNAIVEYDQGILSTAAVAAMPYFNHTVLFIGTRQGQLLKVSVGDGKNKVKPYTVLNISSDEVRQMKFTSDKKYLVVLSKHKVTKIPVEECSSFSSCGDCVRPGDPFCGWCTLFKSCTQKEECSKADVHPLRFVTSLSKCLQIASIKPDKIPLGANVNITLNVTNLPWQENDSYKCYIYGKERPTHKLRDGRLACETPPSDQLPTITSETGDVYVDLGLYSTESKKVFVSKQVGFYSCSAIKGCQNCAEAGYRCNWCTYRGICTNDVNTECPGEFILPIQDRTAGSKGCPRLKSHTTLHIPVGINTNITLPAYDLPPTKSGASYKCTVEVGGKKQPAGAVRVSDTQLVCSPTKYSYDADMKKQAVNLTVTFRNSDQLFVPSTFQVYLYKCWVSRTDCSTCHYDSAAEPYLKCGWCKAVTNKCVVQEACIEERGRWFPYTSNCDTKPNITKVWPLAGPIRGGTEVEIHGSDLGKSFADIANTVLVAGYSCFANRKKYQPSRRIFCNTSASVSGPVSGPVKVTVNNFLGQSAQQFYYQNPDPRDFNPKKGPRSGGTNVNITGNNMNTGRYITVQVAGRQCLVDRNKVTNTNVPCSISPALNRRRRRSLNNSTKVIITFDGFSPAGPSGSFIFTADPTIIAIEPDKLYYGGGLELSVTGTDLDSIQNPKIFFKYTLKNGSVVDTDIQDCKKPESSFSMVCHSPKVPDLTGNVSQVAAAFILDAVKIQSSVTTVTMIPDPKFIPFEDVYELKEDNLILEAKNLENALKSQIVVTVGKQSCKITSVYKEQLVCLAPTEESHSSKPPDGLYAVKMYGKCPDQK